MSDATIFALRPSKLRSNVSNNPFKVPGLDMRSVQGRRFRDLVGDLAGELGGVDKLGSAELALVRQAAMDIVRNENLHGAAMRGDAVDHEEMTRAGNSARSALTKLGIKRAARDVQPHSRLDAMLNGAAR